jgi:DNA replication protein DnaC
LITGGIGTGKTHIAAAIANHLLNQGMAVICMTERHLLGEIKRTYSQGSDESAVREVYERVPLLIIDDLGKEKPSEWTLATLYAIIDGRYERAMPLITTTNYNAKGLIERLTPPGTDKTTATAIIDRLAEMCDCLIINGDSWRTKK